MKKKVLVWVLAAVLLLSMVGCSAANVSSTNDQYVGIDFDNLNNFKKVLTNI